MHINHLRTLPVTPTTPQFLIHNTRSHILERKPIHISLTLYAPPLQLPHHWCLYINSTLSANTLYTKHKEKGPNIFIQHTHIVSIRPKRYIVAVKASASHKPKSYICLVMHVLSIAIVMDIRHFQFPLFTLFTFIKRVIYGCFSVSLLYIVVIHAHLVAYFHLFVCMEFRNGTIRAYGSERVQGSVFL